MHTPGPWTEKQRDPTSGQMVLPNGIRYNSGSVGVVDCDGRWIAIVRSQSREGMHNARLIAAAPELLEALEDAEFLLRKLGQKAGPMRDSCKRSAEDARAAIAKAKGE